MNVSETKYNENDNYVDISNTVTFNDGTKKPLYFRVEKNVFKFFNVNTVDYVLVGLLIPCMYKGEDLVLSNPISKRLLWGIRNYLMPELSKMNPELKIIEIKAKSVNSAQYMQGGGVATGISAGVDSFYTIIKNCKTIDKSDAIKTLCFFNLYRLYCNEADAVSNFENEVQEKRNIAEEFGLEFLSIDTNLWNFYENFRYIQVHTYYALANALCFEGYISRYLYSSGYTLNEFEMNFRDTAHYDLFLQAFLRTESFELIADSNDIDRISKTEFISKNNIVKKHLDVCNNRLLAKKLGLHNCSRCDKCVRTLLTFDILGVVNDFSEVFNLDDYFKNRSKYWAEYRYFSWRTNDVHIKSVMEEAKRRKYKFPKHFLIKTFKYILDLQVNKIKVVMHK